MNIYNYHILSRFKSEPDLLHVISLSANYYPQGWSKIHLFIKEWGPGLLYKYIMGEHGPKLKNTDFWSSQFFKIKKKVKEKEFSRLKDFKLKFYEMKRKFTF